MSRLMEKIIESELLNGTYQLAVNDPESNWDLYINSNGKAISKAKKTGCESCFFGDVDYIKRLINSGYWQSELRNLTDYGRSVLTPNTQ